MPRGSPRCPRPSSDGRCASQRRRQSARRNHPTNWRVAACPSGSHDGTGESERGRAAELAGCSHYTVARYVRLRAAGRVLTERATRERLIDGFLAKVEEWVERSKGKVRADVVHDKLLALGFEGSERTTRRAVARAKKAYAAGHRRVYRPWIPEPGMWFQFD